MKSKYLQLINPVKWIKAFQLSKKDGKYDKSKNDLELNLYSKILSNDMLHYGYFEDTDIESAAISIKLLEDAQIKYAQNIIDQIKDKNGRILDVGCGIGGLSALISKQGLHVEALTPNQNQIHHIRNKYPEIPLHNCKFEDMPETDKYSTVINSESFQYIKIDKGLEKINAITDKGAQWIISDYFRLNNDGINKSSHLLADFLSKIEKSNWKIIYQQDITPNILPMLRFLKLYVDRFLFPIKDFMFEKLRYKKAFWYYLTDEIRASVDTKIVKEVASIDPEKFEKEKKYILFVLEKQ